VLVGLIARRLAHYVPGDSMTFFRCRKICTSGTYLNTNSSAGTGASGVRGTEEMNPKSAVDQWVRGIHVF
jgi:hypothetical protein